MKMLFKDILKELKDKIAGLENVKEVIFDHVEESIKEVQNDVIDFRGWFKELAEKLKVELKGEIADLRAQVEELSQYVIEEVEEKVEDVVEKAEDVRSYLAKLKKENPEIFKNRVELIKHMESYFEGKEIVKEWYTIWKSLR